MLEVALIWTTTAFYAVATVLYTGSFIFGWRRGPDISTWLVTIGLLPHAAGIIVRWIDVGHGPFMNFYEVTISDTFAAMVIFAFVAWRYPRFRPVGIFVLPMSFLLLGAGVFSPHEGREVVPVMRSFWLGVHVSFAKLAYGSYLLATDVAVLQIIKNRKSVHTGILARLPAPMVMEDFAFKTIGFGFIMHTIMIFAGSIWANEAWGSYWSWEPIETWTTFSWLVYGIVLHLRTIHGLKGNRAAFAGIAGMLVVLFTSFGVVLVYADGHAPFLGL